jgi:hypothetical protein
MNGTTNTPIFLTSYTACNKRIVAVYSFLRDKKSVCLGMGSVFKHRPLQVSYFLGEIKQLIKNVTNVFARFSVVQEVSTSSTNNGKA